MVINSAKFSSPSEGRPIAIVGAGLVGGVMAIALATHGLPVCLIDRRHPADALGPAEDGRASAIALAQKRMLEILGVWALLPEPATPIVDIRVADGNSPLFLHYDSRDVGAEALGFMVENRHLRQAILARLGQMPAIDVRAGGAIDGLAASSESADLRFDNGARLSARMVIGADGRESAVRRFGGIGVTRRDYAQTAIVLTAAHERPHQNIAHEHFLDPGPFAILPVSGNRSSIVWTESRAAAAHLLALGRPAFDRELAVRFGDFLGTVTAEGRIWSYPLSLQMAARYHGARLALIGDAAHAIHPIAGQGLNLGYRDVAALTECVVEARRLGLDGGCRETLAAYERWRRFDSAMMAFATDRLNRLFTARLPGLPAARGLGLGLVNRTPPLKRMFMHHAMGALGDLPRLLRGEPI